MGNEVSIHGDVYSYGILLLEMFTGKRPTSSEFGEALSLHRHAEMALPDQAANVIDQDLLRATQSVKGIAQNYHGTEENEIGCIVFVLKVGIMCSEETPTDRINIGDALRELQAIKKSSACIRDLLGELAANHLHIVFMVVLVHETHHKCIEDQ